MDRRDFIRGALALGSGLVVAGDALAQSANGRPNTASQPAAKPVSAPAVKSATAKKPDPIVRRVVAIDAGHGGKDPGAIGRGGTYEKDITFSVARELGKRLEASGRYRVILTRRSDNFIALHQRVALARAGESALFVSLHADSVPNSDARGFSVYTLSEKASDGMTAALAERENAVDLIGGVDLSKHSKQVKTILLDLLHREVSNNSLIMANTLIEKMSPPFTPLVKPHRQANFAVLRAPDVPSILVEMGFLSNREDEKLLNMTSYQRQMADRLKVSIDKYFNLA